ncbi:MAG: DUF4292 domain-containing protein [Bacteroidota bacterium]|nr:DUF4292 domain-containing protein [Bacteroidota bacterium]
MHAFRLFPSLILLSLLVGCAGTPAIDTSKPVDHREVMRLVGERNRSLQSLEGYGKLSIDTPEFANSGAIALTILKPDSLQLEITGPFGMTVARAMVTQRDFHFYNGVENTLVQGETTVHNLRRVLRLSLRFADFLDILTGTVGFALAPADAVPETVLDGSSYTMRWPVEGGSIAYVVDLDYLAVQRFTRRDDAGDILEDVTFRDFRRKAGIHLPQIVMISRPDREESFSLVYDSQSINDLPVEFTFSYPPSARKISF